MKNNKLGFAAAISIVIANMIGVGVFTSLGFQLLDLNNYYSVLLLWCLGGIHAILGAFCYSELSAAFPKSGGEYHFLRISFGNFIGFLSGWTSAMLGFAAPIAAAAFAFSKYFGNLFSFEIPHSLIAASIIILIAIIHCLRINTGAKIQIYLTAGKVLLILAFIITGLLMFFDNRFQDVKTNFSFSENIVSDFINSGFWVGLIFVSYAYSGWNASSYIIDDVENPKKNIPKSIIFGTLIVALLYILMNYVFLISANASELRGKEDVAHISAIRIFGNHGAMVVSAIISFLLISTISSMIMVGPRVIKRIALDYTSFSFFSVDNKNNVPVRAILLQSGISVILLITSSFEFIVTCIGFVLCIFTTLTSLSVIILRIKNPEVERPIKVPLYPITPILFSIFNLWIMFYLLKNRTMESLTGCFFVLIGALAYLYLNNKKNKSIATITLLVMTLFFSSCNAPEKKEKEKAEEITSSLKDSTINTTTFSSNASINKKALILAGLDTSSLDNEKKILVKNINESWNYCYNNVLTPIKKWMDDEHYSIQIKPETLVFYPFSGPDFAFANAFYPNAKTYILAGLENAGNVTSNIFSVSNNDSGFLKNAQQYFYYSSQLGFFRTLDMEKQFKEKGVADVICFYLKRMNCDIGEISILNWNSTEKTFQKVKDSSNGNVCYAKFQQPSGTISELYYFSKNLADVELANDSMWLDWVIKKADKAPMVSLTKSASYLMNYPSFSIISDFILKHSKLHIQDDSGIGFKYITASNRPCTLYGSFSRVLPVFSQTLQKDLIEKYKTDSTIKKLPFAIGYNLKYKETNLQVIQ